MSIYLINLECGGSAPSDVCNEFEMGILRTYSCVHANSHLYVYATRLAVRHVGLFRIGLGYLRDNCCSDVVVTFESISSVSDVVAT